MKLSIYVKKRLFSDIIVLLIVSGIIYLAASSWNQGSSQENPGDEMVLINDDTDTTLNEYGS